MNKTELIPVAVMIILLIIALKRMSASLGNNQMSQTTRALLEMKINQLD